MRAIALLAVMLLSTQLADADATTPSEPPVAAPVCRDATWRGIERAFAAWCRAHPGGGVHGTCAEWLRAYRRCESVVFERDAPAWLVVLKLFDCHDPIVAVVPDGKRWRVREVTMRSLLPTPPPPDLDDLR
jgi:hypothetical protein